MPVERVDVDAEQAWNADMRTWSKASCRASLQRPEYQAAQVSLLGQVLYGPEQAHLMILCVWVGACRQNG